MIHGVNVISRCIASATAICFSNISSLLVPVLGQTKGYIWVIYVAKCNLVNALLESVLAGGFSMGPWSLGSQKGGFAFQLYMLERLFIYLFIYLSLTKIIICIKLLSGRETIAAWPITVDPL